jgi:hypothetical protein
MRHLLLALVLLLCPTVPSIAAAQEPDRSCIRFVQADQRELFEEGVRKSPTFANLADALCRTDVIVYVRVDLTMRKNLAGSCGLITSAPTRRYVSIRVNNDLTFIMDRIATLGHELEHALQIGRAPWVREPGDVLLLQQVLSPDAPHAIGPERVEAATRQEIAAANRTRPPR